MLSFLTDLETARDKIKGMELKASEEDQLTDLELTQAIYLLDSMLSSCRFIDFLQQRRIQHA